MSEAKRTENPVVAKKRSVMDRIRAAAPGRAVRNTNAPVGVTTVPKEWSDTAKCYVWVRRGSKGAVCEYSAITFFSKQLQRFMTRTLEAATDDNQGLDGEPFVETISEPTQELLDIAEADQEKGRIIMDDGRHFVDRLGTDSFWLQANPKERGTDDPCGDYVKRAAEKAIRYAEYQERQQAYGRNRR